MFRGIAIPRFVFFGSLCLFVLGLGLSGMAVAPASSELKPASVDRPLVPVAIIGSLERVNQGAVSPWDLTTVDMNGTIGGLGAGTIGPYRAIGEMLSFAGRTFIRSTDPKTGVKVVEVTEPFASPFALLVAAPKTPYARIMATELKFPFILKTNGKEDNAFPRAYRLTGKEEPVLLHAILEKLAVEVRSPIAVLGWVEAPSVEGTALKKAPINDESLTGSEKDAYLDTIKATDEHLVFFAIVSPVLPISTVSNDYLAKTIFDYNPEQGQPAAALIHVHGALVNEAAPGLFATAPLVLSGLSKVTVKDICHVYGTSTVRQGFFLVYRLDAEQAR